MHRVFVYGTLKRGEPNYEVMLDPNNGVAEYVGDAQTSTKFPLVIASKFNIPFLLNHPGRGHQIIGEVFRVDDDMLQFLDEFEGHPQYYQREQVVLKCLDKYSEDKFTTCWTYLLNKYKPSLLELPCMSKYVSNGPHNQPYVPSDELEDINEVLP